MAAPSNTKWGSTVGSYGRIGISVTLTNISNTQTKRHTEIWFWSKYGLSDSSNTFYYDDQSSTATTSKGSVNIRTTVTSGNGWSTSNQVKIAEYDYTWSRGTSASKKNVAAKLTGIERVGGTMTATTSYTIPAKPSYTIKYNANGGSGAPGNQTKWYGTTLKLSSTKPTRTGYTFQGWSTADDSSVEYASGANYTSNSAVTLYAVWKANTYTVSYDANGGSGAPGNQTKTHGASLTLSSVIPTRTNYNFLGWGTSAGATTIAYAPGAAYTGNTALTLYAIWELAYTPPAIDGFTADRCEADGTLSDDGTYAKIVFDWTLDAAYSGGIQSIMIGYKPATGDTYTEIQVPASGLSGSVSAIIGNGALDTEYAYDVRIVVTDDKGSSSATQPIPAALYTEDFLAGGKGVSFGAPAWREGMDVHFVSYFNENMYDQFDTRIHNNVASGSMDSNAISADTTLESLILTNKGVPDENNYYYVETIFYGEKSTDAPRHQMAYPYKNAYALNHRYYVDGAWTGWMNIEIKDDSGWIYPELTSQFESYSSGWRPRYRKRNGTVQVIGAVKPTASIAGGSTQYTIFTLPEGYRPVVGDPKLCQGSIRDYWYFSIKTTGEATFSRLRATGDAYKTATTDMWFPFSATYLV